MKQEAGKQTKNQKQQQMHQSNNQRKQQGRQKRRGEQSNHEAKKITKHEWHATLKGGQEGS